MSKLGFIVLTCIYGLGGVNTTSDLSGWTVWACLTALYFTILINDEGQP